MRIDAPVRVIKDTYFHTPEGSEGVIVYLYPIGEFLERDEMYGLLYSVEFNKSGRRTRVLFREHELEEIDGD